MRTVALLHAMGAFTLLAVSCSPSWISPSGEPLLVDQDAPRYGRVTAASGTHHLSLVRGDGIAELFVPVQLGTTRGWWQIDTGAAFCVVNTRIARREKFLPITAGEVVTAAGAVDSQLGKLPSVRLGAIEIRDVTVLSLDDDYANEFRIQGTRGSVIGILGADLLDHLDAVIDLRSDTLRLRVP